MNNFWLFHLRVDSSGRSPSAGLWIRCPARAVALLAYRTFYRNHILSFSPSVLSAVRLLLLHEHEPHQPSSSYTKLGLVIVYTLLIYALRRRTYYHPHVIFLTFLGKGLEALRGKVICPRPQKGQAAGPGFEPKHSSS